MLEPTYHGDGWELYCGDCLAILPTLGRVDAVVTDPVWPKHGGMFGGIDAHDLLSKAAALWESVASRAVIILRNDQTPLVMKGISMPFLQCMWMRYAAVGYIGRFMTGNEIAYAFGTWPPSRIGRRVIPGMSPVETVPVERNGHPCPRSEKHLRWLVENWSDETVLDPFAGSGTTGVACIRTGRKFIGIEIDPHYAAIAAKRLQRAEADRRNSLPFPDPEPQPVQAEMWSATP